MAFPGTTSGSSTSATSGACTTTRDHRWAGAELLADKEALADHLQWRDTALAQAVLLVDYLAIQTW
jgi:hypothetical protein